MAETTRRTFMIGAGAAGAAGLLAACGSSDSPDSSNDGSSGGGSGDALAGTADIPVGGGKIISGSGVVVTQPTAGTFKCFTSTCTHQACQVTSVADGKIICACHNSAFSITDGSVVNPPATKPLPAKDITVQDGQIRLA